MKLVAARDIYNVSKLSLTADTKQEHEFPVKHAKVILKGTRFSVGTSEASAELNDADKEKVLWLHHSKAAVVATDKSVERIDREVTEDIARQKREQVAKPSMEELIAGAVASALVAAGVIKAKAPVGA